MTQTFEHAVLEAALSKLFSCKHFSICTLDQIGELLGVNPSAHPNYKFLHVLHCVNYSNMSATIMSQLQEKVVQCLRPQFAFTGAVLAKALLIEGQNHTPIEDSHQAVRKLAKIIFLRGKAVNNALTKTYGSKR